MANPEHLDILKEGVETWNAWRKNNPEVEPDLGEADLQGLDLGRANLSRTNLQNVDLSGVNLFWGSIFQANLKGANLKNANLARVSLRATKIDDKTVLDEKWQLVWEIVNLGEEKKDLSRANLSMANLTGVDLKEANLEGANLSRAYLKGADLSGANLSRANLFKADLNEMNLSGANLFRANLIEADLKNVDLSGANLKSANLARADLRATKIDDKTVLDEKWQLVWEIVNLGGGQRELSGKNLSGANLTGVDLKGAKLSGADLSGAKLSGAQLEEAYLRRTNLSGAKLSGANLMGADLKGANLKGTYLRGADLSKARLLRATLKGADLQNVDLSGADLSGAILRRADLSWVNLRGANLSGAVFREANLESASFGTTHFEKTNFLGAKGLETCHHTDSSTIDDETLNLSGKLPLTFLEGIGIPSSLARALGDRLTIVFTSARYGQLTPIEYALRTTLGDAYIVEHSADRIVVKLDSPEQFQAALDAVVPVLAALERAEPGEVKSVALNPKEGDEALLKGTDLKNQLADIKDVLDRLSERFEEEHPRGRAALSAQEEALVKAVEGGPSGLAGQALRTWFEAGDRIGAVIDRVSLEIYGRFTSVFASLKRASELPPYEEQDAPRELPPASKDDTEEDT